MEGKNHHSETLLLGKFLTTEYTEHTGVPKHWKNATARHLFLSVFSVYSVVNLSPAIAFTPPSE